MSEAQDQQIDCSWDVDGAPCGKGFIFTVNDQEFYKERDFKSPKYCLPHREERKKQQKAKQEATDRREHSVFKPILDEMAGTEV